MFAQGSHTCTFVMIYIPIGTSPNICIKSSLLGVCNVLCPCTALMHVATRTCEHDNLYLICSNSGYVGSLLALQGCNWLCYNFKYSNGLISRQFFLLSVLARFKYTLSRNYILSRKKKQINLNNIIQTQLHNMLQT